MEVCVVHMKPFFLHVDVDIQPAHPVSILIHPIEQDTSSVYDMIILPSALGFYNMCMSDVYDSCFFFRISF